MVDNVTFLIAYATTVNDAEKKEVKENKQKERKRLDRLCLLVYIE
jgi:hypothetical protein